MQLRKILIIAKYTFREIFKSKILLNVFFLGLFTMLLTYVASEFTYGLPERVALDVGLGILSLSSMGISLFLGVSLLTKELESRTIYMVISRPVSRFSFIIGKLVGLIAIQSLNVILLSSMTLLAVHFLGGVIDSLIIWSMVFIFLESIMLLLLVVLISLLANNILAVFFSIALLLLGHSVKTTQEITMVKNSPLLSHLLDVYHFVLPGFYKLNLKDFVLYQTSLPPQYLISIMGYGLFYSSFLLGLIVYIFNRKNLD